MSSFRPLADLRNHWLDCEDSAFARGTYAQPSCSPAARRRQRKVLSETIEQEILPRLLTSHQCAGAPAERTLVKPEAREVVEFTAILLSQEPIVLAQSYVRAIQERGASFDIVLTELFSTSARLLGTLWEDDVCTFTDVTIALSRLQQLLCWMAPNFDGNVQTHKDAPSVLLCTAPGDQHTFGLFVVKEYFRRAGWRVSGRFCGTETELVDVSQSGRFSVIGLSVACDTPLTQLTALIKTLRNSAPDRSVKIMVGGRFFLENPANAARVGADAMAPDGRQAALKLSSLLDTIPMRY